MKPHDIIIGGIRIAFDSANQLNQSYETIGGYTWPPIRMMDGTGVQQVNWRKVRTIINGVGRVPDGLASVNFNNALSIQCMAPLSIAGASNVFTLPSARRSDWLPVGYGVVNGVLVPSPVVVVTNTATVQSVSGASSYQVVYWPVLTCHAKPSSLDFSGRGTQASWTIEAEEA